jgi:hypothetical protein
MTAHSELGASGAHRWIPCPGSVALSRGLSDDAGRYAAEGTAAHELASRVLTEGRTSKVVGRGEETLSAFDHLGELVRGFEVTNEMAEAVEDYVLGVRDPGYVKEVFSLPKRSRPKITLEWVEKTVPLAPWIPGAISTLDHAAVWEVGPRYFAVVTDLKYGKGVAVDAEMNDQSRIYIGAMSRLVDVYYPVEAYAGVIHQPRLDARSNEVLSPEDVEAYMAHVEQWAKATENPDAPLVPGEKQCRFCRAKAICPALADAVRAEVTDTETSGPWAVSDAADYPPERLGEALTNADLVGQWAKAVKDYTFDRLQQGHAVSGWKLVEGRATRAWSSQDSAEAAMIDHGMDAREIWKSSLIGPAAAEKIVGKKSFNSSPLAALVVKPDGRPTLAPEGDKRPAINQEALEGFDNLDEKTGEEQ